MSTLYCEIKRLSGRHNLDLNTLIKTFEFFKTQIFLHFLIPYFLYISGTNRWKWEWFSFTPLCIKGVCYTCEEKKKQMKIISFYDPYLKPTNVSLNFFFHWFSFLFFFFTSVCRSRWPENWICGCLSKSQSFVPGLHWCHPRSCLFRGF